MRTNQQFRLYCSKVTVEILSAENIFAENVSEEKICRNNPEIPIHLQETAVNTYFVKICDNK